MAKAGSQDANFWIFVKDLSYEFCENLHPRGMGHLIDSWVASSDENGIDRVGNMLLLAFAAKEMEVGIVAASNIERSDFDIDWVRGVIFIHTRGCLVEDVAEVGAAETAGLIELPGWDIDIKNRNVNVLYHFECTGSLMKDYENARR